MIKAKKGKKTRLASWTPFQIGVHVAAMLPLGMLVVDFLTENLTVNPIQEATLRTGKTALVLLVLSLACTPLNTVFGWRAALRVRRPLGLYAFGYAAFHLLIFVAVDYGLDWELIREAIFEKRFALVGFAAFLTMLPLAFTSTRGWQKRLGKGWKRVHRLVYLAGLLAVVHYFWLVKADIRVPLVYAGVVVLLLILRLPKVRQVAGQWRYRLPGRRGSTPPARGWMGKRNAALAWMDWRPFRGQVERRGRISQEGDSPPAE